MNKAYFLYTDYQRKLDKKRARMELMGVATFIILFLLSSIH